MAKVAFGTTFLGDGLVWLGSEYERPKARVRRLLWSGRADVPTGSANFVWRIIVKVWARRGDCVALAAALEGLAVGMGDEEQDLKVYEDDGVTLVRTYADCRFDSLRRREGPKSSRGNFEDDVEFHFVTSRDPE